MMERVKENNNLFYLANVCHFFLNYIDISFLDLLIFVFIDIYITFEKDAKIIYFKIITLKV